jgi:hypothetical protein
MGCNRVFDRVLPGYTGFFLILFFLQPGPVPAPDLPGQPAGPDRVSKLCYVESIAFLNIEFYSYCVCFTLRLFFKIFFI